MMNKLEAEKILNAYGAVIANTKGPFRNISDLPYPKAIIKQAFFVWIDAYISEIGKLPERLGGSLVQTYSMLDGFIDDQEVKRLQKTGEFLSRDDKIEPISKEIAMEYFEKVKKAISSGELFDEINEFIDAKYKAADK
jgi:hypothetical protein